MAKQWCVTCGEAKGNCHHNDGVTTNINQAYKKWLERKKETQNAYNCKGCLRCVK
jgi:hypothetical protein